MERKTHKDIIAGWTPFSQAEMKKYDLSSLKVISMGAQKSSPNW